MTVCTADACRGTSDDCTLQMLVESTSDDCTADACGGYIR